MKSDARKHARRIYNDSSSSSGIISTGSVFGRRASGREPGGGGVKRERESTVSAGGADEAGTTRAVAVDTGRSLIAGTSADGSVSDGLAGLDIRTGALGSPSPSECPLAGE